MVQQACEFNSVGWSLNPVKVEQTVRLTVKLHDFSHNYYLAFTHVELTPLTHDEMSGEI